MNDDQLVAGSAAELGRSLADSLCARREQMIDAGVEGLHVARKDLAAEVDANIMMLNELLEEEERTWIRGRAPICTPDEEAAILFPSNMVASAIGDIAKVVAAGNRVRGRMSSRADACSVVIGEIFDEVVPGRVRMERSLSGPEFLAEVIGADDVPFVIVYGGEAIGDDILQLASTAPPKRILFEGPGKDAMILLEGTVAADVAPAIAAAKFARAGQQCVAPENFIVHSSVHDDLVELLVRACETARIGEPTDPDTQIGPLSSLKVPEIVARQLEDARERGATVVCGGRVDGQLVYPTVVTGVTPEMTLFQDETFAPVFAIAAFEQVEEALSLARATRFGLACSVFGPGADAVATELRGADYAEPVSELVYGKFGNVFVNRPVVFTADELCNAFGGYGKSGWILDSHRLRQGPKSFTREATVAAKSQDD